MTEVSEAEALILGNMPRFAVESVSTEHSAARVLLEEIRAERDQPPFDRVTMDGIAIAHADWARGLREFEIAGTQAAGAPALALSAPGQCVKIMTGAVRPEGADTIIPIERLSIETGRARVADDADPQPGRFIHARGSDRRLGERVLDSGQRLGAPEIAVLASAGCAEVAVARRWKVAVVSTGDELVGVDEPIEPFQIRSSNGVAIAAALEQTGLARATRVRLKDEPGALLDAVQHLHVDHDALVLSGGVSMGEFDFVPAVLERLGVELVFHRINQKPGRPMWFGMSGAGKPVFALPGNPVSTLVCVARYVAPAFRFAAGLKPAPVERAKLTADVEAPQGMTYFLPVKLCWSESGEELAEPRPTNTSGDFVSLAGTDGFVELPPGPSRFPAGTVAPFHRW